MKCNSCIISIKRLQSRMRTIILFFKKPTIIENGIFQKCHITLHKNKCQLKNTAIVLITNTAHDQFAPVCGMQTTYKETTFALQMPVWIEDIINPVKCHADTNSGQKTVTVIKQASLSNIVINQ